MSWFRRPRSVRTRLALWYGLAVGIALVVYAGVVFAFFRASMVEQLDDRLHDDYEAVEHAFERAPDGSLRFTEERGDPDAQSPEAPWVEIARAGGPVLLRRPAKVDLEADPFRTYDRTHRLGTEDFLIRVGRSGAVVRRELRQLLLIFAVGLLPAVGLAFLGGRALARRALAPVGAMTERARAVTADRLHERLNVENPHDELGGLAASFNELFARLQQSFERMRQFTSDASHELRTPLTAIRSVGEVGLRERRDEAGYREVIGSMLEETDRLTLLVDGLLTLSRADAGRARLAPQPTDLLGLARDVAAHLGVLAEERRQTLVVEGTAPVTRDVDPLVFRQAVTNLVDNAIKYGPEGSRVTVSVEEHDGTATVAVSDAGPGIPAEHRERVFERFYRVDPSRPRGGAGLGLAIAKWAVEAHAGRIVLASDESRGSTFRVVLGPPTAGASTRSGSSA